MARALDQGSSSGAPRAEASGLSPASLAAQRGKRPKPGPKPRGTRKATMVRLPLDHYEVYEQAAQELGLAVGTYITLVLAERHHLPVPAYIQEEQAAHARALEVKERAQTQMEFDMARAG